MAKSTFLKRIVCAVLCLVMIFGTALTLFACGEKNTVSINIATDKEEGSGLTKGDVVTLLVAVSNNGAYTLSLNNMDVAQLSGNKLRIIADVTVDTDVIVTATLNDNPAVKASVRFVVKAPVVMPTITLTASKADNTRLETGDEVTFSATASNGGSIALSVNNPDVATLTGNTLTITGTVKVETIVTVTATLVDFPSVSTAKSFRVKPQVVEGEVAGQNGTLTTKMLQDFGTDRITVSGTVTDYYQNNSTKESSNSVYDMTVKMSDGKWYGEWNAQGSQNKIIDNYRRSITDGYVNSNGVSGHALESIFIDKNNAVTQKVVMDSRSFPAVWEEQHLWNHIDNLAVDVEEKFVYDPENDVFQYVWMTVDSEGYVHYTESDLYLMTYLAFSLTPMLTETFQDFYVKVEGDTITKILAKTETLYDYGEASSAKDATVVTYTEVELTVSDLGETVVPDPQPYDSPEHADLLESAIAKMNAAKNYTFSTTDEQTYAPSGDPGDYDISGYTSSATTSSVSNGQYASGEVGLVGRITEDAILLKKTGKYSYSMDDKLYFVTYTGYKRVDDNHYDEFEYKDGALRGTHQRTGTLDEVLPGWDFSANVFKLSNILTKDGKTTYTFVLRDSNVVADVANEVSMYYADAAVASSGSDFQIVVDSEGNIVYTKYPYELTAGYAGNIVTKYSSIGSTAFTDEFDGYIPRSVPSDWSELSTDKYYYKHTSDFKKYDCYDADASSPYHANQPCDHVATLDVVIDNVFGDNASSFPTIGLFINVFGDYVYTPYFFDYDDIEDADGKVIGYTDFVSMTTHAPAKYLDENGNLTNEGFARLLDAINTEMAKEGYELSIANTDYSGGAKSISDRYLCYSNGKIQIVINNNHTKYVWIEIYNDGDWTLKK